MAKSPLPIPDFKWYITSPDPASLDPDYFYIENTANEYYAYSKKKFTKDEIDKLIIDFNNQIDWDEETHPYPILKSKSCECGAEKAKTTHARWCPLFSPVK